MHILKYYMHLECNIKTKDSHLKKIKLYFAYTKYQSLKKMMIQ